MRESLQAAVSHLEDYAWPYFLAVAFSCLVIGTWLARRRRRNALRELLGPTFVERKSFVNVGNGIAVDHTYKRFAIVGGGIKAICRLDEIAEMNFYEPSGSPITRLTIETTHPDLPRLDLWGVIRCQRLADLGALLKAMQKQAASVAAEARPEDSNTGLAEAITRLTVAITDLAEEIKRRPTSQSIKLTR